jgi:hypothetical protein
LAEEDLSIQWRLIHAFKQIFTNPSFDNVEQVVESIKPGARIIATDCNDRAGCVHRAHISEHLALVMTALENKLAWLNQATEVTGLREGFPNAMGLDDSFLARHPYLCLFGC